METKVKIQLPQVPNFVAVLLGDERVGKPLCIKHLTDDEIREIGARWTEAMILRAKELRGGRND